MKAKQVVFLYAGTGSLHGKLTITVALQQAKAWEGMGSLYGWHSSERVHTIKTMWIWTTGRVCAPACLALPQQACLAGWEAVPSQQACMSAFHGVWHCGSEVAGFSLSPPLCGCTGLHWHVAFWYVASLPPMCHSVPQAGLHAVVSRCTATVVGYSSCPLSHMARRCVCRIRLAIEAAVCGIVSD